jgi:hypothetical protein
MRRRAPAVALALVLVATVVLVSGAFARTRAYLSPAAGNPATSFVVRFRAPNRTGNLGTVRSRYWVYANGPAGASCMSSASVGLRPARRHAHLRVTLNPQRLGGSSWCPGTYHGRIVEVISIVCQRLRPCPALLPAPETIARFSFRVKPAGGSGGGGSGGQTQGPTFAGLESVTTCGPVLPHPALLYPGHTYALTWAPATDPVTPSAQIVYEIFYSGTPGGENYSQPNFTSSPGATSQTVTIPGTAPYWVVRARDQAGLVDDNTIERTAVIRC